MPKITITIERDTWAKLMQFKITHVELRTFEDIIDYLLNNQLKKEVKKNARQ